MEEKKDSVEEKLAVLSGIVEKLEKGELTLEESLKEYEKGVQLVREAGEILKGVEEKLKVLHEDGTIHDF